MVDGNESWQEKHDSNVYITRKRHDFVTSTLFKTTQFPSRYNKFYVIEVSIKSKEFHDIRHLNRLVTAALSHFNITYSYAYKKHWKNLTLKMIYWNSMLCDNILPIDWISYENRDKPHTRTYKTIKQLCLLYSSSLYLCWFVRLDSQKWRLFHVYSNISALETYLFIDCVYIHWYFKFYPHSTQWFLYSPCQVQQMHEQKKKRTQ